MNSYKIQFAVGLFVIAGIIAVAYLAIRIGGGRFIAPDTYELSARFTNASGLKVGSSVRIAGVMVGEVNRVSLNHDDMVAIVSFRVPTTLPLDDDTVAAIKSTGLIGERYVALKPGASGMPLENGALIVDTEASVDIEDVISRFAFGSVDK